MAEMDTGPRGERYSRPETKLFLDGLGLVGSVGRLFRRHGDLFGRYLARDHGHVDLFGLALARDEDRRARLERAAEDEVRERVLDHALDRAAERPCAHRRGIAPLD